MVEWSEQASQSHEMHCHDLEVRSSKPGWFELGVHSIYVSSQTLTKNVFLIAAQIFKLARQLICIHKDYEMK